MTCDRMCDCEHPKSDHDATGCHGWIVGPDRDEYRCGCDGFTEDGCHPAESAGGTSKTPTT